MKTKITLFIVLSLSIYFSSCNKDALKVTPSAEISTKTHAISNVGSFSISDIFKVNIHFSDTEEALLVEANSNLHQLIDIEQSGGNLSIKIKDNTNISGQAVMNIFLSVKSLQSVTIGGVADVSLIDTLKGANLNLNLRDASRLRGPIDVENLTCDINGVTKMDISGGSDIFQITGDDSAEMGGFSFVANQLDAHLYGASELSLTINKSLSVSGEGASKVYYKGNGVITSLNLKDASKVIQVGK